MMEVVVTTGATRCAKLQSNGHYQQTNTLLFTGRMPLMYIGCTRLTLLFITMHQFTYSFWSALFSSPYWV